MKIVLISNYLSDDQDSMLRFAEMLNTGFQKKGIASEIWHPIECVGKFFRDKKIKKWVDYLDKWIVFPVWLKIKVFLERRKNSEIKFHICDHSNAPYRHFLPTTATSVTCHDVLAIRGAFGFQDAYCPASKFGKLLQKWILYNLGKARKLACVSELTRQQFWELSNDSNKGQKCVVIHNSFNAPFFSMEKEKAKRILEQNEISYSPFILNVGSNLRRKNRKMLIDMLSELKESWKGKIIFAGKEMDPELTEYAKRSNLDERIISVKKPSNELLTALYSLCDAFILPSFSEGFGWTLIEAQACGAPVIASNIEPMPEVSGGSALHADPYDPRSFADSFTSLLDKRGRDEIIKKGFENTKRFENSKMIEAYLDLILND